MKVIYVEEAIVEHPRVRVILARYSGARVIKCAHYGEVFNPKNQHFRLQKQNPALILAKKMGRKVLPTPESFGMGEAANYYFSHVLNCLYDCRYCFLQGMYPSANYVLFVNYEEFAEDIIQTVKQSSLPCVFFSGYDGDSLAMEALSGFVRYFLSVFANLPQAILELRSKSTNIRELLAHPPLPNCVVAFSFTPEAISRQVENGVPAFSKRLQALKQLADQGWPVGLRLDPLIYADDYPSLYQDLIDRLFSVLLPEQVHSVSMGPLRFPEKMFKTLVMLYPEDKLLAHPLEKRGKHYSYSAVLERAMKHCIEQQLRRHMGSSTIFQCSAL